VIRRAAEITAEEDGDLVVVHVNVVDGRRQRPAASLDRDKASTEASGGAYTEISSPDVVEALAEAARSMNASHVVVARHRSRVGELIRGSVASRLRRLLPGVVVDEVRPVKLRE